MKTNNKTENGKLEMQLSEKSDWDLFNRIAELITKEFKIRWIEKVDGLDQRYWDFEIEDARLTLHLEHYLGISLFSAQDSEKAKYLVKKVGAYLETVLHPL